MTTDPQLLSSLLDMPAAPDDASTPAGDSGLITTSLLLAAIAVAAAMQVHGLLALIVATVVYVLSSFAAITLYRAFLIRAVTLPVSERDMFFVTFIRHLAGLFVRGGQDASDLGLLIDMSYCLIMLALYGIIGMGTVLIAMHYQLYFI